MNKKRIIFLTKEPISEERVSALNSLLYISSIEIAGIFVEQAMHLPFWNFVFRTIKRIKNGHIYLPEFVKNFTLFILSVFSKKNKSLDIYNFAKNNKIKIYTVKNIELEINVQLIQNLNPDLGVIFGHRIILYKKLLNIFKQGIINVHYGILPRYAGSHTNFWALTENAKEVGLTIHKLDSKIDHGEIFLIKSIPVNNKNISILNEEILKLAPVALKEAVSGIISGSIKSQKQDYRFRKYWKPPTFFERIKYRKYL